MGIHVSSREGILKNKKAMGNLTYLPTYFTLSINPLGISGSCFFFVVAESCQGNHIFWRCCDRGNGAAKGAGLDSPEE